jgi:hypothetical protein
MKNAFNFQFFDFHLCSGTPAPKLITELEQNNAGLDGGDSE